MFDVFAQMEAAARFDPQITQIAQIFWDQDAPSARRSMMDFERAKRVRVLKSLRHQHFGRFQKNLCNLCNLWIPSLKGKATQ